ncbi:PREDICTED: dihydrolipoyllysine-residue acetyltransferase component 5 of pyruvate dehydrogenase complex, chloroplastic [Populus euphratica]|uniref:Dihydrolipoamide acetyltransferase component of pyruvate dehydrogenase complex n=1 Tax=Populus euphratica TaxID=75702 RepID=A0AAJ6UZ43_POPEU|nr:PREDICTED: dihydrolipoyllysine-residue acetyltransferase component 5 of pyruvate dehydrogenase complex, chloroplastic [Populus euphratica]
MALFLQTTFLTSSSSLRQKPCLSSWASRISTSRIRTPARVHAKIREIFMPALSSTMTEGKIVSWVKSEGDKLSKGESVVVVESDKADMDVETFYDGYLAAIMVEEGGVAAVGSAIALLAESPEEIEEAKSKAASSSPATSPAPAAAAAAAPVSPVSESTTGSGAVEKAVVVTPPSPSVVASAVHPASDGGKRVVASPYAKKLAKDLKVDLGRVIGSGPNGRIVAKDVEAAAAVASELGSPAAKVSAAPAVQAPPGIELGSVVPFTTMQGAVCRNMVESLSVPAFRVGYTITTDALDALYKKVKSKGVTMTALLAKATALALVKHLVINSSCRDGNSFTYNSSVNIAVAVAMDGGLITPVLQDADKVDIYSLSRKWKELVDKARAKQLQPQEYNTGTFTLSNLGMFGVDRFDAILPPGTGAIMAVGASQPTVVGTKDGRIGMKNQMQVNVTADHRVIYGADLAAFLQTLAKIIEDPKDLTF